MKLSQEQRNFFQTFGYLVLSGALKTDIDWITDEFTGIHARAAGPKHDGSRRTCIVPFIDQSAKLCTLLDHPVVEGIASRLLGSDFSYIGGDGNYYTGNTNWHSDGWHDEATYIKIALYLDPVTKDTGCLRVIPGSHAVGNPILPFLRRVNQSEAAFGIAPRDVPCVPLESQPGDVVVFNHNLQHAAFGGGNSRRMFTLNLCNQATTDAELKDLRSFIAAQGRFWIDHLHSDIMRDTATPERQKHLQQVMDNEDCLIEASVRARATMSEPARG